MRIDRSLLNDLRRRGQSAAVSAFFFFFACRDAIRFSATYVIFFAFRAVFLGSIGALYAYRSAFPVPVASTLVGGAAAVAHAVFPVLVALDLQGRQIAAIEIIGVIGGLTISALALVDLWESFGIAPANRGVKTAGMYTLVRHPMYLGYLVSMFSVCFAHASIWNASVFLLFFILTLLRIELEERVLRLDELYREYVRRVPYRLIPRVI